MKVPELNDINLDGLRSFGQLELINAIDSLRSSGIDHYVSLPQIIVCGDQSAGKSSVLEAISGVPFPVKSTLCTIFATEIVLRNAAVEALEVCIIPHSSRSDDDKRALLAFNKKLEHFSDLPELINSAKSAMMILAPGMSFSRDILRVEIHGPDRPHLTIVDLPGLIHSQTKHQTADDVILIQEVVQSYMKEERTIILAVVSAKYEYSNQIILRLCRKIDNRGRRTLGVITKPDTLLQGSESEKKFISLANNQDIEFHLGWHVLKNLDSEVASNTLENRNTKEEYFFSRGNWASLPQTSLGIKSLRSRLSKLLFQQIAIELPALVTEIETKASACLSQLNRMGKPRDSLDEKRTYLIQVSQSFQRLVTAATEGTYTDKFFGDATTKTGFEKRLRAVIQKLSIAFAAALRKDGREYVISPQTIEPESKARVVTHDDLCKEVMDLAERTRGRELPGLLNPMIISDLFRKLSSPWKEIASGHINDVWDAAQTFLSHAVKAVTDVETAETIMNVTLRPQLAQIRQTLHEKLNELLEPHREGHPITYGDSFEESLVISKPNRQQISDKIEAKIMAYFGAKSLGNSLLVQAHINMKDLHSELLELFCSQSEPARYNGKSVIKYVDTYYEIARGRLIDDIAVQVIESNLVAVLRQILDPLTIVRMTEAEINEIASETEETRETRQLLQTQLETLNKGVDLFRRHQKLDIFTLAKEFQRQMELESPLVFTSSNPEGDEVFERPAEPESEGFEELNTATEEVVIDGDLAHERLVPEEKATKKKKKMKKAIANEAPIEPNF